MITLRPNQLDLHERIRASIASGRRAPLAVAPCGFGKTNLFCDFAHKGTVKGKRSLILSHREELVEQISGTLDNFNVKHSFIAASHAYHPQPLVHVGSVMSVARRLQHLQTPDFILLDEAHHAVAGSWKNVLAHWSRVPRIGFTATPSRMSGEPLGEIFDDMIVGPTAGELIQMGYLSDYVVIAPEVPELNDLPRRGNDFDKKEIAKRFKKSQLVGNAVAEYAKHASGYRAVVFCVSIDHAHAVEEEFSAAGYRAATIDGTMRRGDRKELVKMFRDGFIDVLCTCDLISEGFDLPAIECAIMLRPTESLALWIQQFGRALRIFPGKRRAIILDHSGNTWRHQWLPESEVEWSLTGHAKVKSDIDSGPGVRTCPFCHAAQFAQAGIDSCKICGTLFAIGLSNDRNPKAVAGELVELDKEALARQLKAKRIEQGKCQTFEELVEFGRKQGMKGYYGWAKNVWNARQEKKEQILREAEAKLHARAPQPVLEF